MSLVKPSETISPSKEGPPERPELDDLVDIGQGDSPPGPKDSPRKTLQNIPKPQGKRTEEVSKADALTLPPLNLPVKPPRRALGTDTEACQGPHGSARKATSQAGRGRHRVPTWRAQHGVVQLSVWAAL